MPGATPRAVGLTRERLARAALTILDDDGIDGLTMRRLAEALGVGTMTVYGYVRSKEELLDLAIDAAVTEPLKLTTGGPWREQLRALMHLAWRTLNEHPALVQVRMRQPILRPEALRFGEAGMAALRRAGFEAREAAPLFRLLFTYTFGYVGLSPERAHHAARRQAEVALAALPADAYPHLTVSRSEFAEAMAGQDAFAVGLDCILDGIEARAPRAGKRPRG